ncbi:hypothetical protein JTE90_003432 [Oedothorax gibbosus]|uniref:TTF-type domain-containing protein n=1 Tax=Oedothorax gibbosus TaxID=931172 RepID=A0AAV6TYF1_9ARAC|nr:hypothetical protein JTE90_003432 [Oedothorax gibbosus]
MKNSDVQPRGWLIYSETKGSVFCAPCLLFGDNNETNAFTGEGFCDWKNPKARVEGHENSSFHKTCVSQLKTRGTARGRVDEFLAQQLGEEISYWKQINFTPGSCNRQIAFNKRTGIPRTFGTIGKSS